MSHDGQNPGDARLNGQTIVEQLIRNMEVGKFEMAYTVLLPCIFDVYLHPEDHARLSGVFNLIVDDAKRALAARVGKLNTVPTVLGMKRPGRLAKEYKIPVDPEWDYKGFVGYDGPHKTSGEKIESFIRMLNKLEPGKTYIFLDHPGLCNDELKAVYHIGYEDVCEDRQGVTDVFTSDKVKAVIKQKGIQLITYRDLK